MSVRLSLLALVACALVLMNVTARAQVHAVAASDATQPVRLVEIYGPRHLAVGQVANFRVRVSDGSSRSFTSLWDFGTGVLSAGNPVAYVFPKPGVYEVTVTGTNAAGADRLSTTVTVVPSAPSDVATTPSPASPTRRIVPTLDDGDASADAASPLPQTTFREASLKGGPRSVASGGYAWVVASDLWNERIERRELRFRLEGFRTGVYRDTDGPGSPVYRLLVGHFDTEAEALAARPWLPRTTSTPWLLHVGAPR